MTDAGATAIAIPDHVLLQKVHSGEAVLLHLENESYFSLNAVGARMLDLLTSHSTFDEALAALADEYDADRETLLRDMESLLEELLAHGLVVAG